MCALIRESSVERRRALPPHPHLMNGQRTRRTRKSRRQAHLFPEDVEEQRPVNYKSRDTDREGHYTVRVLRYGIRLLWYDYTDYSTVHVIQFTE